MIAQLQTAIPRPWTCRCLVWIHEVDDGYTRLLGCTRKIGELCKIVKLVINNSRDLLVPSMGNFTPEQVGITIMAIGLAPATSILV